MAVAVLTAVLTAPAVTFAAVFPRQATLSGTVTVKTASGIIFKTATAASYVAEISQAGLQRKNGSVMRPGEILIGDKVQVSGKLWNDNSINAVAVRNLSLYTHTGTLSGKITGLNPAAMTLTVQTASGSRTVNIDQFTVFKNNTAVVTYGGMALGMTATVKGVWDRDPSVVLAKEVKGVLKLVNITITGTLLMKGDNSLSVGADGVLYGVDITRARLLSKSGKSITAGQINPGDTLRAEGKHIAEGVAITASLVRDVSVLK